MNITLTLNYIQQIDKCDFCDRNPLKGFKINSH